jgi:hypothetical protein
MAGFSSARDYVDSIEAGQSTIATWRKSPSQATAIGVWFDLSMSPGNPIPQYYASSPAVSATLPGAEGINHGGAVSPQTKHVKNTMVLANAAAALPAQFMLCDYLLYYPFLDMGSNDPQPMNVDVASPVTLPRYTTGDGVQVMAVQVGSQVTGGATFQITYTNENGVAGRLSQIAVCNTTTSTGSIISSDRSGEGKGGPFISLQAGDKGVRSIESFQMVTGTDVGLITLVLVKPICDLPLYEQTAPSEVDFMLDAPSAPVIKDGAYLNFIVHPSASFSATAIHGILETVWS